MSPTDARSFLLRKKADVADMMDEAYQEGYSQEHQESLCHKKSEIEYLLKEAARFPSRNEVDQEVARRVNMLGYSAKQIA